MTTRTNLRPTTDGLVEMVRVCAGPLHPDDLLRDALPVLAEHAHTGTAMIVRRLADGDVLFARAGAALNPDALDLGLVTTDLAECPVPSPWVAEGVRRVAVRRLPVSTDFLVLAWRVEEDPGAAWAQTAVEILVQTLERRHLQDQLRDLTVRVDGAQRLAVMGDYDWHIPTDTNRWSDQLYRIYGYPPQSFNASYEAFLAHIHPDDRDRVIAIHQHAYATGEPYEMVERIVRADGEIRHLSSSGEVICDESGTPVRMRGTCVDITDRVLAEQSRERSAKLLNGLVESSPDAILVLDAQAQIVLANGRASDLLGADPVGHELEEICPQPAFDGLGVEATSLDGRTLLLDVTTAELSDAPEGDGRLTAVFVRDAAPRLAGEAVTATLREARMRRQQALELNDNIVQGLTAAILVMRQEGTAAATGYLETTLTAARRMMNEWLTPLDGGDLQPGDLVRTEPSTLGEASLLDHEVGPSSEGSPAPRRILVVDDNKCLRRLMCEQLKSVGRYDVVGEAGDGQEAVHLTSALQPHVVLLDLSMPQMDGLQALPLILEAMPDVRVIVMSGFDEGRMAQRALAAGAVRYVEKGLKFDLTGVIDEVLNAA